ncbi:hypothetical protein JJC03_04290 [Flavobacterium oreochromis]|uniref:hypothetical protein n=1 Tax=Flavobacterium oreochromis TaxID=2906078 RepID=UPI001CE5E3DE|nr:hypothetical protein [Flavobacterium oreochromis]QYS87173.1 hypothetical protein JJC03_04290 [Flavobacterium oreochromis]
MGEAERTEKIKRKLHNYIIGGNQAIVKFVAEIIGVSNFKYIKLLEKKYLKTDKIEIKDLNFYNEEEVQKTVKDIAYNYFQIENIDKYFISNSLPFGNELSPSHWDSDNNILAKKMIMFSKLESNEKEKLLKLVKNYKYEGNFSEIIYYNFNDNEYIKTNLFYFISEIKRQEIDIEFRLKLLSETMKKLNLSIIKNNEVINSRAYNYKKNISKTINKTLFFIKQKIELELEFYIKTINSSSFLGYTDEVEPREFLIGRLVENKTGIEKFLKLENKLIANNYLSKEKNRWYGKAKDFIEFYQLCENSNIFNPIYKSNSKGVKYLRKLYRFDEGQSIDKKSKREKYNATSKITYHSF